MAELICITGIDGTGKSTLIKQLSKNLKSVAVASIWDIMDGGVSSFPFKSKKEIDNYLCELSPDSRLLFFSHALKYSIDIALKSKKKYILLNAYYYKYFATETALGANKKLIKLLITIFPFPQKVILLNLSIENAAKRKTHYSRYECGLARIPTKNKFLIFQKKTSDFWNALDKSGWHILDASLSPKELYKKSLEIIDMK